MKVGMKPGLTVALLATAVVILASCASATTSSQIAFHEEVVAKDQNEALIYVYRVPNFVGSAVSLVVKIDGQKVADLKQNAYAVFHVMPGEHEVTVGHSFSLAWAINQAATKKYRTFTAAPKDVYFLKSQAGVTFLVTREEALKEIVEMKYDLGL